MIHFKFILLGVTLSLMVLSCKNGPLNKTQPSQSKYAVTIKKENGVYRLYKNGLPFFVKGAAGYDHISELAASGAANYNLHFQLEPLADIHFSQGKPIYLQYTEFNTDRKWHMIFKWMIKSKD